jgi:hypothetical protein
LISYKSIQKEWASIETMMKDCLGSREKRPTFLEIEVRLTRIDVKTFQPQFQPKLITSNVHPVMLSTAFLTDPDISDFFKKYSGKDNDKNRMKLILKSLSTNDPKCTIVNFQRNLQIGLYLGLLIGSAGVTILCSAIQANQVLKELNLEDNDIGMTGAKLISAILMDNKSLRDLNLGSNFRFNLT